MIILKKLCVLLCALWLGVSIVKAQSGCPKVPVNNVSITPNGADDSPFTNGFDHTINVNSGDDLVSALKTARTLLATQSVEVLIEPGDYYVNELVKFENITKALSIRRKDNVNEDVNIRGSVPITSWRTNPGENVYYGNYDKKIGLTSSTAVTNPGFYTPSGTPNSPRPVALRQEVLTVNNDIYQQIILVNGISPAQQLRAGTFAVIENDDFDSYFPTSIDKKKFTVVVQPRCDANILGSNVTLSTDLHDFSNVNYWVKFEKCQDIELKNLNIQHFASSSVIEQATVVFEGDDDTPTKNVWIENVNISYNNGTGLAFVGVENVTVKGLVANYNGFSGVASSNQQSNNQRLGVKNLLMEDITTNFNNWRGALTNYTNHGTGGMKLTHVDSVWIKNHEAIGNLTAGLWFDVDCKNVRLYQCRGFLNATVGLFLELSAGPFDVEDCLYANSGFEALRIGNATHVKIKNSVFYASGINAFSLPKRAAVLFGTRENNDPNLNLNCEIGPVLIENSVLASNFNSPDPIIYLGNETSCTNMNIYENFLINEFDESGNIYWGAREFDAFSTKNFGGGLEDLEGWLAKVCPTVSNSIWDDPRFVNPDQGDFMLMIESPVLSSGFTPYAFPANTIAEAKQFFSRALSQIPLADKPISAIDQITRTNKFVLINADTDTRVRNLLGGDYINLTDFDEFSIEFDVAPSEVESVRMFLERKNPDNSWSNIHTQSENQAPYALFGDNTANNITNYNGDNTISTVHFDAGGGDAGEYRLTVDSYCQDYRNGGLVSTDVIEFSVADESLEITGFEKTLSTTTALTDNQDIDFASEMSITAVAGTGVGSVEFTLDGPITVKKTVQDDPFTGSKFSLFGNEINNAKKQMIPPGVYTLTAIPYKNDNAQGAIGTPTTISFKVHPYIQALTLVDVNATSFASADIQDLNLEETINLPIAGTDKVSFRAKISTNNSPTYDLINNRKVRYNENIYQNTESVPPYAYYGDDTNTEKYNEWPGQQGSHIIKAKILNSDNTELAPPYTRLVYNLEINVSSSNIILSEEQSSMSLAYPNPTTQDLSFDLNDIVTDKALLLLRNPQGKLIFKQEVKPNQDNKIEFKLPTNLPERIYFYEIQTEQGTERGRLVIKQ